MDRIKNLKYYSIIRNVFRFEIFYKSITLFLMAPILRKILKEYLNSVSSGIVFNQDIILSFLSLKGIVVLLVLFAMIIAMIYYELFVIINIIALEYHQKSYSLRKLMLKSFIHLKSIWHPSIVICGAFIILLLPLVHIGYINSFIPRWDIPPFIFGELRLTTVGNLLIMAVYCLYYSLFLLLIFTPMYIVLKQQSFITSIKSSVQLLKKMSIQEKLKFIVILCVWMIIEYIVWNLLPYPVLHNRDFNFYFIRFLFFSASFRYSFLQYILLFIVITLSMIFFLRYLYSFVSRYETDIKTIDCIPIEVDRLNQKLITFQKTCKESIYYTKEKLKNLKIYQKHKAISRIVIVVLVVCLLSLYLRMDSLVHRPWVIGHRGSGYQVENTIEAVADANDNHADYAEIDIQLSSDGVPIVFHDTTLSRLAKRDERIGDLTSEQLKNISLYEHGKESQITSLNDLIQYMKEKKMSVGLLIELKPSGGNDEEMAEKVIQVIEDNDFSKQAIFMSLNYNSVQYLKQRKSEWWVGYCIYGSVGDIDESIWELDINFLAMEENRASTALIQKAASCMIPVYIWTVDNSKKMKQYLDMGVCGLITNYPDVGKMVVNKYEQSSFHYYYYEDKGYPKIAW